LGQLIVVIMNPIWIGLVNQWKQQPRHY
jgi:hypothetical protein